MTSAALDRMRAAVALHAPVQRPRERFPQSALLEKLLDGRWVKTDRGSVFVRDAWYPLDHTHGSVQLGAGLDITAHVLSELLGEEAPEPGRLAYFDIETTGISGTGTYILLAGVGSFEAFAPGEPVAFRLRQYFLADIAEEPAMLGALADDLRRFQAVVTYNGRSFDVPFLETRLTLSRIASPCRAMQHFDLLHPVRRMYRHRMPACTLADVERLALRIERIDDIPGRLIPALYFDYARAGRVAPLRAVFRHNEDDVVSLVGVLVTLARLIEGANLDPDDAASAGRFWERAGQADRAAKHYAFALPWLEGGDDWAWVARAHAALCKRKGRRLEAVGLWLRLWADGDEVAGLELAKHYEHHARDLPAAEEVMRVLLLRALEPRRIGLIRRMSRIRRKLKR